MGYGIICNLLFCQEERILKISSKLYISKQLGLTHGASSGEVKPGPSLRSSFSQKDAYMILCVVAQISISSLQNCNYFRVHVQDFVMSHQ